MVMYGLGKARVQFYGLTSGLLKPDMADTQAFIDTHRQPSVALYGKDGMDLWELI